eukprot:COSAG01_NODE_15032_length_1382_cov_19.124708_2_plen_42_part_00
MRQVHIDPDWSMDTLAGIKMFLILTGTYGNDDERIQKLRIT